MTTAPEDKSPVSVQIPILVEISELAKRLMKEYGPRNIYTYIVCGIGGYLLFCGIFTRKLSLSVILSILFTYFAETFAKGWKTIDESSIGNGIFKSLYEKSQNLSKIIENSYVMLIVVIFIATSLFMMLIGTFKYILALTAIYLFYNTYVDYFINGDEKIRIFLFVTTVLILVIVLVLFEKLLRMFLIVLFAITGSLVFLVTIEHIFEIELGIVEMVEEIGYNFQVTVLPKGVAIFAVFCLSGGFVQLFYIPSIAFL